MGAIIGFPSPSVRPWQDLQRLPTPCLAQESGGGAPGPWAVGSRVGRVTRWPGAGPTHHPALLAQGGRTPPGGPGSHANCTSPLGCAQQPFLCSTHRAGCGGCTPGGSLGTAPLRILPPAHLLPAPRLQVRGRGGLPAKPFPVRPPGRGLLIPEWWALWGARGSHCVGHHSRALGDGRASVRSCGPSAPVPCGGGGPRWEERSASRRTGAMSPGRPRPGKAQTWEHM